MPELVGMLGTIAALLTLVGSYRLADYFFNRGPELAGLLAVGVTAAFLILFEPLMLLMGTLALVAPVAAVASHYGLSPASMLPSGRGTGSGSGGSGTGSGGSGTGTGGSGTGTSTGNTGGSTTGSGSGNSGGGSGGGGTTSGNSGGGGSGSGTTGGGSTPGIQCPNCGEQNDPDATFCANSSCGYKLDT
ncbi:zinc ribbon domain-containing protein [Haloglomus salinum]|jgi:hypothetical protein|uniref:zinc ribbon domain-containing protein n=1 Tax=Haloglomus salinum TaxID=2962673 RepID=UPI0020C94999|nr:zinc ribbon domain-containing protein [Haloglomus salinum]